MILALSSCPRTAGLAPNWPAEICTFWAAMAAVTSPRGKLVLVELAGIEPDAHGILRAEGQDIADARQAADRILDRAHGEVAQVGAREAAILGNKSDDQEKVLHGLVDDQALELNLRRQEGGGLGDLVLHLHLRNVRVGADFERDRDRNLAGRQAGRLDIAEMVNAVEPLLDDLCDRILKHLGRCAGIGCRDRNRGRGNARVLRHRQALDRDGPADHEQNGNHPGKNGPIDKESGHALVFFRDACRESVSEF